MINIKTIKQFILNILFPIECLGCRAEDAWLCSRCLAEIPLIKTPCCPVCRIESNGQVCLSCQPQTSLNGLFIAASYENKLIELAIHRLKYNYIEEMAKPLATLLIKLLNSFDKTNKPAILQNPRILVLAPVPLHRKRLLERGFNQSSLLGQNVSDYFQFKYWPDLLFRNRYTQAQAKLSKSEREHNLTNAFGVNKNFDILGKNVIIVDDVATTLTTLNECAKVLKLAGCKEVWGLVIARGN